jgi:hypothetical protein
MGRAIGVAVQKHSCPVCFYQAKAADTFKTDRVSRIGRGAFRKRLHADEALAVESTGATAFFVREVAAGVKRVRSVNPVPCNVIAHAVQQTDRIDALTSARL